MPSTGSNVTLAPDFIDFVAVLNEHGVVCVLVGGYAVGVHGVVRATGDIDFLYERSQANVRRLCAAMAAFGAPATVIDTTALLAPGTITAFGSPPFRIDLLNEIDGVSFDDVWRGSIRTDLGGQPVRVIGLAELRANKAASGRTKDREDLAKLPAVEKSSPKPTRRSRRTDG